MGNSIAAFTNYAPNLASAGPTSIVRLSANETLTTNKVVGAILFDGAINSADITITENGFTLGIGSGGMGAIVAASSNTLNINGGTIDFGANEGILYLYDANITIGTSAITGSNITNGLTFTDTVAGTLTLSNTNSYTGTTTINGPFAGSGLTVGSVGPL